MCTALVLVAALVASAPQAEAVLPAPAQGRAARRGFPPGEALRRVLADVEPGRVMRVRLLPEAVVQAPYQGLHQGALWLGAQPPGEAVPAEQVQALFVRGRSIGRGALLGTAVGGLAGLAAVATAGAFVEPQGDGPPVMVFLVPLFIGGGLASGALVGTLLGALIPTWEQYYGPPSGLPALSRPSGGGDGQGLLSLTVRAAYAHGWWLEPGPPPDPLAAPRLPFPSPAGESAGGLGLQVLALARLSPYLALGPDFGWYRLGASGRTFHAGAAVRGGLPRGSLHPYLLLAGGLYDWAIRPGEADTYTGGSLGAGVRWQPGGGPLLVEAEARWHEELGGLGPFGLSYGTASVGAGLHW